jgi:hypothetical protein
MNKKILAALKTLVKYLFWSAVAATIQAAINYEWTGLVPEWAIVPIAAALKSAATFWATKKPKEYLT